jgi:signal transduction histidine kinase
MFEIDKTTFKATYEAFLNAIHIEDRDAVNAAYARSLQSREPYEIKHRLRMPDGRIKFVHERCESDFDAQGKPLRSVGTVQDITELTHAEDALRQLNVELEHRVEQRTLELSQSVEQLRLAQDELVRTERLAALGSMVAGVAHELNTPIGNALVVTSSLQEKTRGLLAAVEAGTLSRSGLTEYAEHNVQGCELAMRGLHQAAELIRNFKQVAVDQTSATRREFFLGDTVQEVLSTLRHLVRHRAVKVMVDVADGIRMDSYPGPLAQVITNLFNNALIHAFEGQQAGSIRIEAQLNAEGQVVLRFSDDGIGIPAENMGRIFDPFFTTKLGKGGSGLGLNIVYNIVSSVLGGWINVESQPGSGTLFTIRLPLVAPITKQELQG